MGVNEELNLGCFSSNISCNKLGKKEERKGRSEREVWEKKGGHTRKVTLTLCVCVCESV